uniref:Uncharacterized protein n=1 Tax=Solanum tuberosum TaxID=4113 RepID=M1B2Z6_SOLTU
MFLPQNVFLLPQETFKPLSHQSLPKNGYKPPENGNFRWFLARSIRVHQSYPPHVNFTSFPTNFLTQNRPRNRRCLPKKVRDAKNHWILVCYALNLIGLRVESSPKIGYKRNHLASFEENPSTTE